MQEPCDEGGGEESKWLVAEIHKCVRDILRFVVGVDVGILYSWFVMYSCGLYGRQIELQQMLEKQLHDKFTLANTITHMCNVFKVSYPLCSCVCSRTFFPRFNLVVSQLKYAFGFFLNNPFCWKAMKISLFGMKFDNTYMQMEEKRGERGEHTYHIILRTKSSSRVCGEIDRDLYNRSCVEIDTYEHLYELLSGV